MKKISDNYSVDHMNAHICADGSIGYCYPCSKCENKKKKKKTEKKGR